MRDSARSCRLARVSSRDGQRVFIYYVWTVLDNPNKYANWKFRSKPKFASANRARDRNDEERQT